MKTKLIVTCIFMLFMTSAFSQVKEITWFQLNTVFENKYMENYGDYFLVPQFDESIRKLQGEKIKIKGYVLDLVQAPKVFLLSKLPMAQCFFCGGAGPDSVMELQFKETQDLETDQVITVTGILVLNNDDIHHCNYILKNVEIAED